MTAGRTDMREAIMAAARAAVQARGYNALSFRDLAAEVGIKSASVHYHFPTKGDLAVARARRYTDEGEAFLAEIIGASSDASWCMDQYTKIFRAALVNDNRMCLCGIMSAELDNLPESVRAEVDRFTEMNVAWLGRVLSLARPEARTDVVDEHAMAIFSAIEGAQLGARGRGRIDVYDRTIEAYRANGLIP